MRMLSLDECKRLNTDGLYEQIKIRRELQNQMVGGLYPGIVEDEIYEIKKIMNEQYGATLKHL